MDETMSYETGGLYKKDVFQCNYCDKLFSKKVHFRSHLKINHADDVGISFMNLISDESEICIMQGSKKLNELDAGNRLWKVFIKNETTPLVRKENDRLYKTLRKLRKDNPG